MEIWSNSLRISNLNLENGCTYPKEYTATYSIFYVKNGEFRFSIADQEFHIRQNELLFIPPTCHNVVYKYIGQPYQGITIRFRFFPNVDYWGYPPQTIPIDDEIAHALHQLTIDSTDVSLTTIWKFYRLLSFIQAKMRCNVSKKRKAIQPALDYINIYNDYTTDSLAALCGISRSAFCAAFREVTGESVVEARHRIQAFKAELLLRSTDLSVEEIAEHVGFSSVKHFRTVFFERYHTTPLKFRQQYKHPA